MPTGPAVETTSGFGKVSSEPRAHSFEVDTASAFLLDFSTQQLVATAARGIEAVVRREFGSRWVRVSLVASRRRSAR